MADLTCPDQPRGSGILCGFLSLVILPPTNAEGSITALVAACYEQAGIAQESLDQHTREYAHMENMESMATFGDRHGPALRVLSGA